MIRIIFRNFFSDSVVMKLFHLWGWLCVALMVLALGSPFFNSLLA